MLMLASRQYQLKTTYRTSQIKATVRVSRIGIQNKFGVQKHLIHSITVYINQPKLFY